MFEYMYYVLFLFLFSLFVEMSWTIWFNFLFIKGFYCSLNNYWYVRIMFLRRDLSSKSTSVKTRDVPIRNRIGAFFWSHLFISVSANTHRIGKSIASTLIRSYQYWQICQSNHKSELTKCSIDCDMSVIPGWSTSYMTFFVIFWYWYLVSVLEKVSVQYLSVLRNTPV